MLFYDTEIHVMVSLIDRSTDRNAALGNLIVCQHVCVHVCVCVLVSVVTVEEGAGWAGGCLVAI